MANWDKSEAYYEIHGFISAVSVAVQGKKISDNLNLSAEVKNIHRIFDRLNKLVDETPALEQPQRFGNKAYRDWYKKLTDSAIEILQEAIPENKHRAVPEIMAYFVESFGNATRIDYGTGHELAFIMFLCCLFKIGVLQQDDKVAVCLKIFNEYLVFVRRLQQTYRMEPAGSHGVWSLDDFQFVPFIWGSAQLAINPPIEPAQFPEPNIIEMYKDDYMFVSCIDYIMKVKIGLFAEHSNQLWCVSGVQSWVKIQSGLVRMYQKEVLAKFPVIQHVLFGSLLTMHPVERGTLLPNARLGFVKPLPPQPIFGKGSGDSPNNTS